MQVSWIEADDLKDLLARIAPAEAATPAPSSWDIMPTVDPDSAASFIITAEEPFVAAEAPQKAMPPAPTPEVKSEPKAESESEHEPEAPAAEEKKGAEPTAASRAPELVVPMDAPVPEDSGDHSAAALPLSRIRDKLRAIRQRAHDAGMLAKGGEMATPPMSSPVPAPATKPPPSAPLAASPGLSLPRFEAPAGDRLERLQAFANWARQVLHEDGGHLLVMNDDGELLWGGEAKAGLVLSAMMAWGATLRSSASTACGSLPVLHQNLASGHMLTAIPCETTTGVLLHAAVVGPARVPDEIAMQLRQALVRAAGTQFA